MVNTREKILKTLLNKQRCTINELAKAAEINPVSVRHHVDKLEAIGWIASEELKHGVGRPRLVYFLTEKGMEQFPTRYLKLTVRLLQQLKESLPPQMVDEFFTRIADDLVNEYTQELELENLPIEKRLDIIKELLMLEGFNVNWEKTKNQYIIHEANCPYYHVGQSHPEICTVDSSLIANVLSVPVEKVQCILDGDSVCTYVINMNNPPITEKETHERTQTP